MSNPVRNILLGLLTSIVLITVAFVHQSSAGVYFLKDPEAIKSKNYRKNPCIASGFPLTKCFGNQTPANFCPSNKSFFRRCVCSPNRYKYDIYNCPYPKMLSGESCDGKFEACGCEAKYKYSTENCPAPKGLSGLTCNGKNETCSCPYTFYKTCSQGGMIGVGESCGGKYQSCKCASFYKTCNQGPDASASTCREENGVVKYSRCFANSCENGGYIDSIPENHKCSEVKYFENTCYKDCRPLTCFDGGLYDRNPSDRITCPRKEFGGKPCFDCDKLCGYCDRFTGKCKVDCMNDCKKGMWFENKLNGGFICKQ
ncbi:MAG: hypothetical protein LBR70_02350 [Lactobacillaceae bacterium]|jgi:hypothetical protein|nr:hypothetical protein [Lactobacillaceae bacterium]